MRFAIYLVLLFSVLPFVLLRPFFGLCVYYVVSLLQPKYFCWHPDFQDAMLVGVPLVIGAIAIGVRRTQLHARKEPNTGRLVGIAPKSIRNSLIEPSWPLLVCLLLLLYVTITRVLVPYPLENNVFQYRSLCKMLLVMALLTGLASDFHRLRIIYIVVALSVGFWAIKGGLKVILLGPHQVYGKTYDNNLFALTTAMVLPMVFYYALSVRRARWRNLLIVCAALMCLGIIGSQSRAGFLALAVVLGGLAWTSRYRFRAIGAVAILITAAMIVSSGEIQDRISSIIAYRQDESARSRFWTWSMAREILLQNPMVGVGFGNFELAKSYIEGSRKAAHNIYLQNLAELGLLGHPLWLLLVVGGWFSMLRFMRKARSLPTDFKWAYHWSRGLWLGLTAYCVHGFFHNEEYLELMFVLLGLHIALRVATRRALVDHKLLAETKANQKTNLTWKRPAEPHAPRHPGHLFGEYAAPNQGTGVAWA